MSASQLAFDPGDLKYIFNTVHTPISQPPFRKPTPISQRVLGILKVCEMWKTHSHFATFFCYCKIFQNAMDFFEDKDINLDFTLVFSEK